MTRKETIRAILKCYFTGFKDVMIDSACERICELEQEPICPGAGVNCEYCPAYEPCDDAISRQAVLDEIDDTNRRGGFGCKLSYTRCRGHIEQLPSVPPTCEEREKGECPYYAG